MTVEDTADTLKTFPASARNPMAIALKIQQLQWFTNLMAVDRDDEYADPEHWKHVSEKLEEAFNLAWAGAKGEVEKFNYID